MKKWIEKVENHTKKLIMSGMTMDGYKLVNGRKRKQWKSQEKITKILREYNIPTVTSKPISPAQVLALLKKEDNNIKTPKSELLSKILDNIDFIENEPCIVQSHDRRTEYKPKQE